MHINWFAITIMFIWLCATISSFNPNCGDPFGAAVVITFFMGIGYALFKRG